MPTSGRVDQRICQEPYFADERQGGPTAGYRSDSLGELGPFSVSRDPQGIPGGKMGARDPRQAPIFNRKWDEPGRTGCRRRAGQVESV